MHSSIENYKDIQVWIDVDHRQVNNQEQDLEEKQKITQDFIDFKDYLIDLLLYHS
jgi:hypothetical protein